MSILLTGPRLKVFGTDGRPLAGGTVTTYAAGTTTPKTAYSDSAATVPKANPFTLDAYGEADCWLVGTYKILIKDSSGVTLPGYPVDNIPGSAVAASDLASTSGAGMVGTTSGSTVQQVLNTLTASSRNVPVRQAVLNGPHTTTGAPNLGGATGSTTVTTSNIAPGSNRLLVSAGSGFNDLGALNNIGFSDTNLAFSGLSTNGVMYLYVDINTSTGVLTTGSTTLAPVYGDGTPSVTNGQFTYAISEGIAYVGNGSTAAATPRVFIGEVDVAAGVVSAIRWYAYRGAMRMNGLTFANNAVTNYAHNLGTPPEFQRLWIVAKNAIVDGGYAVGDVIDVGTHSFDNGVSGFQVTRSRNTASFFVAANIQAQQKNTTVGFALTPASWEIVLMADRGF